MASYTERREAADPPQVLVLSLPNLRLARHVNIADLVHMHKPLL